MNARRLGKMKSQWALGEEDEAVGRDRKQLVRDEVGSTLAILSLYLLTDLTLSSKKLIL